MPAPLDLAGALRLGLCARYYPTGPVLGCARQHGHAGACGPAELDQEPDATCRRRCPPGDCHCPLPNDPAINTACGDTLSELCRGCGCGRACTGCHCAEE